MTKKKIEHIVDDVIFPDSGAIEWIAHAPNIKVGGDVAVVDEQKGKTKAKSRAKTKAAAEPAAEAEASAAAPAKKPRKSTKKSAGAAAVEDKPKAKGKPGRKPGRKAAAKNEDIDDLGDDEVLDLDIDGDDEGVEDLAELEELERVADGEETPVEAEPEDHVPNGYSSLVRLGRQRGWVTVAEINDHLPDNVVRSEESLAEITEQLLRLSIQVFEAPPSEDDILMNEPVSDDEDISEEDAAAMLTPEESAGLSKDPLRAYLRGVGSHKLLTRAGEIEVAKQIETFTAKLLSAIIQHPMAVEKLVEIA